MKAPLATDCNCNLAQTMKTEEPVRPSGASPIRGMSCAHRRPFDIRRTCRFVALQASDGPLVPPAVATNTGTSFGHALSGLHRPIRLPSLSFNHADRWGPAVAIPSTVWRLGRSYSSKITPRDLSSATSATTSLTLMCAWV